MNVVIKKYENEKYIKHKKKKKNKRRDICINIKTIYIILIYKIYMNIQVKRLVSNNKFICIIATVSIDDPNMQ